MYLENYIQKIEEELNLLNFPSDPQNLYDPLVYFLGLGGKRLRPVLTLMATELGNTTYEKSIHAALAIEIFHNFSLIHDDIMDEAPLRRGMSTVHKKWNTNIAILSGDVLLVKAYELIAKQDNIHIPDLLTLFNKTAVEVCEGQQLDMDFECLTKVSADQYIEMIRLKTSVLLGCALEFGFIISNQTIENRRKIYDFGVNLGIAFQIQDDILDLFGDPDKVGKQVGGDVKANKKTLLYILADELTSENKKEHLNALKDIIDLEQKVELIRDFYVENGILESTKKRMNLYFQKALDSLNSVESVNSKEPMFSMVDFLFNRQH